MTAVVAEAQGSTDRDEATRVLVVEQEDETRLAYCDALRCAECEVSDTA